MKTKLSQEEKALYDSIEKGEWVEIEDVVRERQRYQVNAKTSLKKAKE